MSLVNLLANFPNYSARKVRRLAKQLSYLENVNSPEAKGIGQDLMEYNLLQATTEARMNDDVKEDALKRSEWFGKTDEPGSLDEACSEINEMRNDWAKLGALLGFKTFVDPSAIFAKVSGLMADQLPKLQDNQTIDRITVTPLSAAVKAIDELRDLSQLTDEDGSLHAKTALRAKGIVSSVSFIATRITTHESDGSTSVSHL
jgi:hypothetical protein